MTPKLLSAFFLETPMPLNSVCSTRICNCLGSPHGRDTTEPMVLLPMASAILLYLGMALAIRMAAEGPSLRRQWDVSAVPTFPILAFRFCSHTCSPRLPYLREHFSFLASLYMLLSPKI